MLVPEIALTPQTIRRFAARFPGKVTVWHSELGDGERFDVWRRVRTNHPAAQVVVGSRSALFLPFPDLGLIVLDEEHEPSYKQERTPRYHARTVAIELGRLCAATVILGSATPALETYYAARRGRSSCWRCRSGFSGTARWTARRDERRMRTPRSPSADLRQAVAAELPQVRVVDMRQELRAGNRSMFSRALSAALRAGAGRRTAGDPVSQPPRGQPPSSCAATAAMWRRARAARSADLSQRGRDAALPPLQPALPRRRPSAPTAASKRIRYFGAGTQNVEEAVKLEFPDGAHAALGSRRDRRQGLRTTPSSAVSSPTRPTC